MLRGRLGETMTNVLLFHHALGLSPGVVAFADELRAAGHTVTTPDLFEGAVYEVIDDGVAHAQRVGFEAIIAKGVASAEGSGDGFVVAGFSLGGLPAQKLAQTHPSVGGAILYHAAVPSSTFGGPWPTGVALQLHFTENDPWVQEDLEAARELAAESGGYLWMYPGSAHLVADSSFSDYDPAIAAQIMERTLAFLDAQAGQAVLA